MPQLPVEGEEKGLVSGTAIQNTPKKTTGLVFFFNPGFFQRCLEDGMTQKAGVGRRMEYWYAPVTCRGGGEGPDGWHDRVGWDRKGYGVYL